MTFLESRILTVGTKSTLPPEWRIGHACFTATSAHSIAELIAEKYGWCFVYEVEVQSVLLPMVVTEYYVTPINVRHRLTKTRILSEGIIFS